MLYYITKLEYNKRQPEIDLVHVLLQQFKLKRLYHFYMRPGSEVIKLFRAQLN